SEQNLGLLEMTFAQSFDRADRADQMAFRGLLGNPDQCIRNAGERGDDDDGSPADARRDDSPSSRDRLGVAHRRSAELEDDHESPMRPQCTINSALRTDAPAAPRMTLCPIATSLTSKIGSGRTRPTTTVIPLPVLTWRRGWG